MSNLCFANAATKEVFLDVLTDLLEECPRDPLAHVREFRDAEPALARRLCRDAWRQYCGGRRAEGGTLGGLIGAGLEQVRWRQVAEHLLALAFPERQAVRDDGEDLAEGGSSHG